MRQHILELSTPFMQLTLLPTDIHVPHAFGHLVNLSIVTTTGDSKKQVTNKQI